MKNLFLAVLRRDLLLFSRRPFIWATPVMFFLIIVLIFTVAATPSSLRPAAPGIVWAAALLGGLLSQEGMFRHDEENGFMEQVLVSPHPLPLFVLAKTAAHWLLTGAPVLLMAPLAVEMLSFPPPALPALLLSLPLGTAAMSLLASFAAALTLEQKNALLPILLVAPLAVPVLIFAAAVSHNAAAGLPTAAPLSFLAALAVLSLTLLPLGTAGVLRATGGKR